MKTNEIYLIHIIDAINKIKSYLQSKEFSEFQSNPMCHNAVIRELEIIGEAVKNIDITLLEKYPQIPWRAIKGMRDKQTHGYFGVDLQAVWRTAKEDLTPLEITIKQIIKNEKELL
jgi:uncharacterized protein with HEPN domain